MSDREQIRDFVANHGNNFHCKVLSRLKESDWSTLVSPYYKDQVSDKPREIDIVAEKLYERKKYLLPEPRNGVIVRIIVRLYIECKYVANPFVFWFHGSSESKIKRLIQRDTSVDSDNSNINGHHYLTYQIRDVAKLFASYKPKGGNQDPFYSALNQSLNSRIYYSQDLLYSRKSLLNNAQVDYVFNYPVVILNSFDEVYRVGMEEESRSKVEKVSSNFGFETHYAFVDLTGNSRNEHFLIDVVSLELVEDFFESLEEEIDSLYDCIKSLK